MVDTVDEDDSSPPEASTSPESTVLPTLGVPVCLVGVSACVKLCKRVWLCFIGILLAETAAPLHAAVRVMLHSRLGAAQVW